MPISQQYLPNHPFISIKKTLYYVLMSVIIEVSPNTFEETGFYGTYLTSDGMLFSAGRMPADHVYATKRKHLCSIPPHETWRISIIGLCRNAFLAYCFRSRKQMQRYEDYSIRQKIIVTALG